MGKCMSLPQEGPPSAAASFSSGEASPVAGTEAEDAAIEARARAALQAAAAAHAGATEPEGKGVALLTGDGHSGPSAQGVPPAATPVPQIGEGLRPDKETPAMADDQGSTSSGGSRTEARPGDPTGCVPEEQHATELSPQPSGASAEGAEYFAASAAPLPRRVTPFRFSRAIGDTRHRERADTAKKEGDSILQASALRAARHTAMTPEEVGARLEAIKKALPRRDSKEREALKAAHAKAREIPPAPGKFAEILARSVEARDATFADADEVGDLIAEDCEYITMDKVVTRGKEPVRAKMNEGMEKLIERFFRASRHKEVSSRMTSVEVVGPTRTHEGTFVIFYKISVVLIKVKIREEFMLDDEGKILKLVRTRHHAWG